MMIVADELLKQLIHQLAHQCMLLVVEEKISFKGWMLPRIDGRNKFKSNDEISMTNIIC